MLFWELCEGDSTARQAINPAYATGAQCSLLDAMKAPSLTPQVMVCHREKKRYGKKCDLWSVGVIAYILICGSPPFYASCSRELFRLIQTGMYKPMRGACLSRTHCFLPHVLCVPPVLCLLSQPHRPVQMIDELYVRSTTENVAWRKRQVPAQGAAFHFRPFVSRQPQAQPYVHTATGPASRKRCCKCRHLEPRRLPHVGPARGCAIAYFAQSGPASATWVFFFRVMERQLGESWRAVRNSERCWHFADSRGG